MRKSRPKRPGKPLELTAKELDYTVSYTPSRATSSDDIPACEGIIGQQRAIEAVRVGLAVHSRGYNIFITGLPGTGRTTTISHLLKQLEHDDPHLKDICYVHNFKKVDNPQALVFTAGEGKRFKKDKEYLI